jgi:hypothetical protein
MTKFVAAYTEFFFSSEFLVTEDFSLKKTLNTKNKISYSILTPLLHIHTFYKYAYSGSTRCISPIV